MQQKTYKPLSQASHLIFLNTCALAKRQNIELFHSYTKLGTENNITKYLYKSNIGISQKFLVILKQFLNLKREFELSELKEIKDDLYKVYLKNNENLKLKFTRYTNVDLMKCYAERLSLCKKIESVILSHHCENELEINYNNIFQNINSQKLCLINRAFVYDDENYIEVLNHLKEISNDLIKQEEIKEITFFINPFPKSSIQKDFFIAKLHPIQNKKFEWDLFIKLFQNKFKLNLTKIKSIIESVKELNDTNIEINKNYINNYFYSKETSFNLDIDDFKEIKNKLTKSLKLKDKRFFNFINENSKYLYNPLMLMYHTRISNTLYRHYHLEHNREEMAKYRSLYAHFAEQYAKTAFNSRNFLDGTLNLDSFMFFKFRFVF